MVGDGGRFVSRAAHDVRYLSVRSPVKFAYRVDRLNFVQLLVDFARRLIHLIANKRNVASGDHFRHVAAGGLINQTASCSRPRPAPRRSTPSHLCIPAENP
jgi:hypothetical protein